jgi:hypothetical protein
MTRALAIARSALAFFFACLFGFFVPAASNPHRHNDVPVAVGFFGEGAHLAGRLFIF